MITQAYFENIRDVIKRELQKANNSIIVVVAWFTDSELYKILCDKVKEGITVSILISNDPINRSTAGLNFDTIRNLGGEFILLEEDGRKKMMHNKFCIIDNETVINGSYNWTLRAQSNDENIVVTKGSKELANEFLLTFLELKKKQLGESEFKFDLTQICKRLEILRNTVSLQDKEDIVYQTNRLNKIISPSINNPKLEAIDTIIELIFNEEYSSAIKLIDDFLREHTALTIYIDPELAGLKLEIKSLEIQISSLQDEKSEMDKRIFAFEVKHNIELGQIISKILELRKKLSAKKLEADPENEDLKKEYEESKRDFDGYKKNSEAIRDEKIIELNVDEQNEIKSKYRRASKLCHPDVVSEVFKDEAEKLFNELRAAYSRNDIETVNNILDYLENGKPFKAKHETITAKDLLRKESISLRRQLKELLKEINEIKLSDTYNLIISITNLDIYFKEIKAKLKLEYDSLNENLGNVNITKEK